MFAGRAGSRVDEGAHQTAGEVVHPHRQRSIDRHPYGDRSLGIERIGADATDRALPRGNQIVREMRLDRASVIEGRRERERHARALTRVSEERPEIFLRELHAELRNAVLIPVESEREPVGERRDLGDRAGAFPRPEPDRREEDRSRGERLFQRLEDENALVIHELATNAAKYGALSGLPGYVTITWSISDGNITTLKWQEHGGPIVSAPEKEGFGTKVISRAFPPEYQPDVKFDYRPEGLQFTLRFQPVRPEKYASASDNAAA